VKRDRARRNTNSVQTQVKSFLQSRIGGRILIAILVGVAIYGALALIVPPARRAPPKTAFSVPPRYEFPHFARPPKSTTLFYVDFLTFGKTVIAVHDTPVEPTISAGTPLVMIGWAVDQRTRRLGSAVYAQVDGGGRLPAQYGISRPDVARYFHEPAYRDAGFRCTIPTGNLRPGVHSVDLIVINSQNTDYYLMPTHVRFKID
jgi:hypothetical protein